jgi:putative two-component system response regulator
MEDRFAQARILIVDDEPDNVEVLRRILDSEGYAEIRGTNDPREVPELTLELEPDLILLDVLMPHMSGYEVLERLRQPDLHEPLRPVLVLTSDHSRQAQRDAFSAGAKDFITKPLSPSEVRLRVRNLLETRMLHRVLREQNDQLEDRVRERTLELEEARLQILHRLARAAEYRDDDTGQHTRRVGQASSQVAEALGLSRTFVNRIRMAAQLHDVGKIGIPDSILLSAERLSRADFEVMKTHCVIGADLLASPDVPILAMAAEIAMSHHERWDGNGYPHGLEGEDVPLTGRIVAVADTFDALTHARPYKAAWSTEEALAEVRRLSGVAFDPEVVSAFENVVATSGRRAPERAGVAE